MSKIKVVLGSDPELMVVNESGVIVPSCELLPGTKEEPHDLGNGCSIQVDNVMAELTVPPTNNPEEMFDNIQKGIEATLQMLPKGYSLIDKASHIFTEEQLQHPTAQVFGCEPDFHPYGRRTFNYLEVLQNPPPKAGNPNLRTCGGHIHICLTDFMELFDYRLDSTIYKPFVNMLPIYLDLFLALPAMFKDSDDRRRELYGKPGAFRYKPYGIEYRTLSNYWVLNQEEINFIYNTINNILNHFKQDRSNDIVFNRSLFSHPDIKKVLDNYDLIYNDLSFEEQLQFGSVDKFREIFKYSSPSTIFFSTVYHVLNTNNKTIAKQILDILYEMYPQIITKKEYSTL